MHSLPPALHHCGCQTIILPGDNPDACSFACRRDKSTTGCDVLDYDTNCQNDGTSSVLVYARQIQLVPVIIDRFGNFKTMDFM